MIDTINCTNCGSEIENNISKCDCGYSMSVTEKNEITTLIRNANSVKLIDENIGLNVKDTYQKLGSFELDKTYFRSNTAKKHFAEKNNFIQKILLPEINFWRESVMEAEHQIANEKLEVYGKIYQISEFIINEFFGRFRIKEDNLEFFQEIRDYSKYEIAETLNLSDLDFSTIQTTDIGKIGSNMLSSGLSALENGSLNDLANKSDWSKSDKNRVAAEVGVAMGMEVIDGVFKLINQNSKAIKHVREANLKLNNEMRKVGSVISGLSIEEKELKKLKRLYDRCDLVLDITYKYKLLPIVINFIKNPLYINYKNERRPYDLEQEKIQLDETILKENIDLSFWGCLFQGKKSNFINSWNKRVKSANLESKYNSVRLALKESPHRTLNEVTSYKSMKTEEFRKFEKLHRKEIIRQDVFSNHINQVKEYAAIFKNIQKHITKNNL